MQLLIDIGNTSAKIMIAHGHDFVHHERRTEPWTTLIARLTSKYAIDQCVISNVGGDDAELNSTISEQAFPVVWVNYQTTNPVCPSCIAPLGLGSDRWAADIGALALIKGTNSEEGQTAKSEEQRVANSHGQQGANSEGPRANGEAPSTPTVSILRPGRNTQPSLQPLPQSQLPPLPLEPAAALSPSAALLVIDAGTCITYDLMTVGGKYLGGNISPGVQLRLKAMHEHTAHLPLLDAEGGPAPMIGTDTPTAMRAGAVTGARMEMEGFIREIAREHHPLYVFTTGGNHFKLSEDLPATVNYDQHLIFHGLAEIAKGIKKE